MTYQDLLSVTSLSCSKAGCLDVTDLQYMTNLTELSLGRNQIGDIGALAGLTKLEYLYLEYSETNEITME